MAISEFNERGGYREEAMTSSPPAVVKSSGMSNSHGLGVEDLVLGPPASIPITSRDKFRQSSCGEQYRQVSSPAWTRRD
jgi:hypothetical protein